MDMECGFNHSVSIASPPVLGQSESANHSGLVYHLLIVMHFINITVLI